MHYPHQNSNLVKITHLFVFFSPDKFGMERYLHKGMCLDACPEAFYHTTESTCEPCSENCHVCTSHNHCLKCNSSYYVSDGVCVKQECGEGKQSHSIFMKMGFCVCERPFAHLKVSFLLIPIVFLNMFTLSLVCALRRGGGSRL